ncbi:MAG: M15 family metallopeptidase [Clostridia bacterium]|nr:M15 family metallopeptidase [Clostridia bacterium]
MRTLKLNAKDIAKGSLVLVNPSHPLKCEPADENLMPVQPGYPHILLERQTARMLAEVIAHLGCEDQIVPVSGYRTIQEQRDIYTGSMRDHGKDFTQKYVAIPGCSEHQTGLAIDLGENRPGIDFIRPHFPYTGVCQAFRERSAQYGFIERYRSGHESITQIEHEPWHFRYVGCPHSELMNESGFALEEYANYLKQFPNDGAHLRIRHNSQRIEISYVPVQSGQVVEIRIPDYAPYQVSGNNDDGFVVTLWSDLG